MHLGPNIPKKQATFRLVSNFLESAGAAMTQKIATIYMTGDRTAGTPSFKVAWTTVKSPVLEPKTQTMYMPCSKVKYCEIEWKVMLTFPLLKNGYPKIQCMVRSMVENFGSIPFPLGATVTSIRVYCLFAGCWGFPGVRIIFFFFFTMHVFKGNLHFNKKITLNHRK